MPLLLKFFRSCVLKFLQSYDVGVPNTVKEVVNSHLLPPIYIYGLRWRSGYSPWNDGDRKQKCSVYCTGYSNVWASITTKERKIVLNRLKLLMEL